LVPNSFVVLEQLPLTRHGKVDVRALPEPESSRPAFRPPRGVVETRVARLWQAVLGVERVGADDDFFALGGHSLLIPRLLAAIKAELRVSIPVRAVLRSPRLTDFAALVSQHGAGSPSEPAALPDLDELRADARLPDDIRVPATPGGAADAVLLTGGTGVLGARLLADILRHTNAPVYCLIRAESEEDGRRRLRVALAGRGLWRADYETRIVPVPGDLTRPRLGLDQHRLDELADLTGEIYHSAALINLLYPYGLLRPTNVDGTLNVVRLAARTRAKHLHFISTLGVFFSEAFAGHTVSEWDEPADPTGIGSTFATSKWVADALVRQVRERGATATVYRLARVTGDSGTGESKVDDLFCRTLKTYVQLGVAPVDGELDISPVDHLARAIGALSRLRANRDFHFRCRTTLPQGELIKAIAEFGYPLEVVDTGEFWGRVGKSIGERDDLGMAPFAGVRGLPSGSRAPVIDCTDTERVLAGLGITHPVPDAELIRRYLAYFVRVGFLPEPASTVRSR
jgi:thioester reductase-like protein